MPSKCAPSPRVSRNPLWLLTTLSLLIPAGPVPETGAARAECIDYEESMRWVATVPTPGAATAIVAQGSYAYLADDTDLRVLDIHDPAHPRIVGAVDTPGHAVRVDVLADVAYVACQASGLVLIDIENPIAPAIIGSVDTPGVASAVEVVGDLAYVADGNTGLRIYDVTQPGSPALLGQVDTPGTARHLALAENVAFVADSYSGLSVIDVSDPHDPRVIGGANTPGEAVFVELDGELAYVADGPGGLQVIDASDPANPSIIGNLPTEGAITCVRVDDAIGYVTEYQAGLRTVDLSDPTSPVPLGFSGVPYQARSVDLQGQFAFVAYSVNVDYFSGVQVVDCTILTTPSTLGSMPMPGHASYIAVAGRYAYVAPAIDEWESVLLVCDVSNPASMEVIGSTEHSLLLFKPVVQGNYTYWLSNVDFFSSMRVFDVSNPKAPRFVSWEEVPIYGTGLAVSGNRAYVVSVDALTVFDISDPLDPHSLGTLMTPEHNYAIAVRDSYGYVACGTSGLLILSLDPSPVIIAQMQVPQSAIAVLAGERYVYVADWTPAVHVVDVDDPSNPTIVATVRLPDRAFQLAQAGSAVYAAASGCGLQVIDVTEPTSPRLLGAACPSATLGVAVADGFVLQPGEGLFSLPLQCEEGADVQEEPVRSVALVQVQLHASPNPFSSAATIAFTLPRPEHVTLRVFDLLGRSIALLYDAPAPAGRSEVRWTARDPAGRRLPSGAYLLRLETEEGAAATRTFRLIR